MPEININVIPTEHGRTLVIRSRFGTHTVSGNDAVIADDTVEDHSLSFGLSEAQTARLRDLLHLGGSLDVSRATWDALSALNAVITA